VSAATVTVLTPLPPWWCSDRESDDGPLSDAVALLARESLTDHDAEITAGPELVDTYRAIEGLTYVWTLDVNHSDACPCHDAPGSPLGGL
jgi:hypothetical protein